MISAYIVPHPPAVVPEVHYEGLLQLRKTFNAYVAVTDLIYEDEPETIVIISPHAKVYNDGFYIAGGDRCEGNLAEFGAPDVSFAYDYDTELINEIALMAEEKSLPVLVSRKNAEVLDHGAMVPLHFISKKSKNYKLVRISPCFRSSDILFNMGRVIERAAAHLGRKIAVVASGDLSHYLKNTENYSFAPEGPEFDKRVTEAMQKFDTKAMAELMDDHEFLDKAGACGMPCFCMLAGAIMDYRVMPKLHSYEGPLGVGYAVCSFLCEDECVRLATRTIENFVRTRTHIVPDRKTPKWMTDTKAGVFVSIKKYGQLRGCMGTVEATTDNIAEEICKMAVAASSEDTRFGAITEEELAYLNISVDILNSPVSASMEELDPMRYGVIVQKGYRKGLLLPGIEGINTVEEQIDAAIRKAGIAPGESVNIEKFTVERHS